MSSVGQALGAVVGGVIGFMVGGPAGAMQGASLGMGVGGYLDPPKGPSVQGPRLTDLSSQSGSYGVAIPRIYGTMATYGNVFWLENNALKEVVTKKKQKSGGKGGGSSSSTITTYTYFATFAIGLCEGPISGIRRIWIGSKLYYDAGSNDIAAVTASNIAAKGFTLYTGTNTQTANPRIQAQHGANTPAYRGLAYIVFYDLALAGYGNSMMGVQVKVEVITQAHTKVWGPIYSDSDIGFQFGAWPSGGGYQLGTPKILKVQDNEIFVTAPNISAKPNNYIFSITNSGVYGAIDTNSNYNWDFWNIDDWEMTGLWYNLGVYYDKTLWIKYNSTYDIPGITDRCVLGWGNLYSSDLGPWQGHGIMLSGTSIVEQIHAYRAAHSESYAWWVWLCAVSTTEDKIIIFTTDQKQYIIDFAGNLLSVKTHSFVGGTSTCIGNSYGFTSMTWDSTYKRCYIYSTAGVGNIVDIYFEKEDGSYGDYNIRISTNGTSFATDSGLGYGSIYTVKDVIYTICKRGVSIYSNTINTVGTMSLQALLQAESLKSKYLTSNDIDTSSIDSIIGGYRVSNVATLRSAIEPLQGAYHFDAYQQGYKVKFRPRGNNSITTVLENELIPNSDNYIKITESKEMSIQLPKEVSVKFFDTEREYDQGEQSVERINPYSVNKVTLDMPLAMTPAEAIQKADILLYLYWMERSDFTFTLPITYNYLEPSDVITINNSYGNQEFRLTELNYTNTGNIECKAKISKASTYTSVAVAESGQSTGNAMEISGSMAVVLMDLPCITSDFDIPAYVVAANGYSSGWPGGVLYRSKDTGQSWETVQGFNYGITFGTANNIITGGNSTKIDSTSVLVYKPVCGGTALSSVTIDQMLNGSNVFAYGINGRWEIIQAANCILQSDGTYFISDLLRGRAGTEHNTSNHEINDYIVELDSQPALVGIESSNIGSTGIVYRGITVGKSIEESNNISFTYTGMNLECLSPIYLRGDRNSSNNWSLYWIRRTRVGGEWADFIDAPLSETSESYDIEIYTSGYTTLKQTLTSSTATVTYTSAQQITDFGSVQSTLYLKIYQNSSMVGRGIPLITSITQ